MVARKSEVEEIMERLNQSLRELIAATAKDPSLGEAVGKAEVSAVTTLEIEGARYALVRLPAFEDNRLTRRQLEILELIGRGYGNAGIARKLEISSGTVTAHLNNIYQRLDIHTRAELARYAAVSSLAN